MWVRPTVTASTMIADLNWAGKVGCHNGPVDSRMKPCGEGWERWRDTAEAREILRSAWRTAALRMTPSR